MKPMTRKQLVEWCNASTRPVLVLRGMSGAGKSTLAEWLRTAAAGMEWCVIASADNFFCHPDGSYRFDASKLTEAHGICLRKACHAIQEGLPVIIDNTNTTNVDAAPYIALAAAHDAPVLLLTIPTPIDVAAPRNVHGVVDAVVEAQAQLIQEANRNLPMRWNCAELVEG